ncbi:MAG: ADP-ribosylglycohydrolase family protein [Kosmotogaceae bacterium]|nr:ADP-ribosylglycohydrolase family protein [Kosmotogaceae bacterium]
MNRIFRALEAFAVGDAMGMVTEFMTRRQITTRFDFVSDLLEPEHSPIHKNLTKGQITDDTEQVLYLIKLYSEKRNFSQETVKEALCRWEDECDPVAKGYIGPSTKRAIEAFKSKEEFESLGTTSGAPMRVLAPALCNLDKSEKHLIEAIRNCTNPTHNTNLALEASLAVGFAYYYAARGLNANEIAEAAIRGSKVNERLSCAEFVGPSAGKRLSVIREHIGGELPDHFLDRIYYLFGTTMEAVDVAVAAIAIGLFCRDDVWLAIRMGASIGGDTDTIAAIAGALSSLQGDANNIPHFITQRVLKANEDLDLEKHARYVEETSDIDD